MHMRTIALTVIACVLSGWAGAADRSGIERYHADFSGGIRGFAVRNYQDRVSFRSERAGDRNVLVLENTSGKNDTAWSLVTPPFMVTAGSEFAVWITSRGSVETMEYAYGTGRAPAVLWLGEDRSPLLSQDALGKTCEQAFVFNFRSQGDRWIDYVVKGRVPRGARFAKIRLGGDAPDILPGKRLEIADLAFYERKEGGTWTFAAEGPVDVRETVGKEDFSDCRGAASMRGRVSFRDDGMPLVDGKPFFPIGMTSLRKCALNDYSMDKAVRDLKEIGCNVVHTYERLGSKSYTEMLDACERHGVMALVEGVSRDLKGPARRKAIKQAVDECRNRGIIFSWVIGDDTADHRTPEEVMRDTMTFKAADPTCVTTSIDVFPGEGRHLPYVHACDAACPEVYPFRQERPIPGELERCVVMMDAVRADNRQAGGVNKGIFPVLQAFCGFKSWQRYPTIDEIRAETYATIAAGARGVTYYTYFSRNTENVSVATFPRRFAEFAPMTRELNALLPFLVQRDAAVQPKCRYVSGAERTDSGLPSVVRLMKDGEAGPLLVAVNISEKPVEIAFRTGADADWDVISENRIVRTSPAGELVDRFDPRAAHVYRRRNGSSFCIGAMKPAASVVPRSAEMAKRIKAAACREETTRHCEADLKVDFETVVGKVKPMHAGGQGPLLGYDDYTMFRYLKDCGMPYSRLHDVGGAYGKNIFVDIPNLFRDFDADENDPANYDFAFTDRYLAALVANGVEPYFRLGVTIENAAQVRAYRIHPPKDFAKWARICEHVIRHYTEGWAAGFRHKITYWEIWNEPEDYEDRRNDMWWGSWQDYCRLYETAAKHLKRCFPSIKIGAYGSNAAPALFDCDEGQSESDWKDVLYRAKCFEEFVDYVKRTGSPLDFFSYHGYRMPSDVVCHGEYLREYLDAAGYGKTELHLNEWLTGDRSGFFWKRGSLSASIGAMLCGLQESPCDIAMIYDARCALGKYAPLFDPIERKPGKAFHVMKYFNELYRLGDSVKTTVAFPRRNDGLWATAARKGAKALVLVANPAGMFAPLACDFGKWNPVACRVTDDWRTDAEIGFPKALPPHAVLLVTLEAR